MQTAARHPKQLALDAPDATLTYEELDLQAHGLADRLGELGIGRGDRVLVQIRSGSAELYTAILGVLAAGAAYVPVDADDPEPRAADIRERSQATAEIGDGLQIEMLRGPTGHAAATAGDATTAHLKPAPPRPEDDAWIIFTSGSTGKPKGVAVSHRSAAAFVDAESRLWSVEPSDRVLAGLSVGFDAACEEIWTAWRNGAALVPAPRELVRSGVELGDWLLERGITVVSTVPTIAALWDESCLHNVRLLILGGEACPDALGWRLAAGREVWNTYGPTEATVVSTAARIVPGQPISIGCPLDGWEVAVLRGQTPAALGEPGELVIAGVGLGRYLDSDLDAERYAPLESLGWERAYRTGDIVVAEPDGLRFVGRRDDQVKVGGRRIELGELESVLARAPGIRSASCAVRESAAGNKLLVGYVVGEAEPDAVRRFAAEHLPAGLVPLIAPLEELPRSSSGKVDRKALPWPIRTGTRFAAEGEQMTDLEAWVAERFIDQLGPVQVGRDSNFFEIGGTSLTAARLISVIRARYRAVAMADLYKHPTVGSLSVRLAELTQTAEAVVGAPAPARKIWGVLQLAGVLAVSLVSVPTWLGGILAVGHWYGFGPQLGWGWLIGGWLLLSSPPARGLLLLAARRALLRDLEPGRYPRQGWLAVRVAFVERLADACRTEALSGTPWAARFARLSGHAVGEGARLGTLPPVAALVTIGAGATIESDVDLHGWWMEGDQLVIGEVRIGTSARVGTRAMLMPGSEVGEGAEVEPGSVVDGAIPRFERWAGSPAVRIGRAGETWPNLPPPPARIRARWKLLYGFGLVLQSLLPFLAGLPEVALWLWLAHSLSSPGQVVVQAAILAPLLALTFVVSYALIVALGLRIAGRLIAPGLYGEDTLTAWALWFTGALMTRAGGTLFPLYASSYTRRWLRLAGVPLDRGVEVSTAVGLNRLTSFGAKSFAADDVVLQCGRSRGGWLEVAPIHVGEQTFLGNGALLAPGSRIGARGVIGLLTTAPPFTPDDTCWLGAPALELPRQPVAADPRRTIDPPWGLRFGRRVMDTIRILLPSSVSAVIGAAMFALLDVIGSKAGILPMALAVPLVVVSGGVVATLVTIAIKWLLMGRYEPGDHPLYSWFVWRDEIVNTCQELLAGAWLLDAALGTPLVPLYLRLMGTKVGRDVWIEALTITEFDLASMGDGAVLNRHSVLETHLFHDRVLSTGRGRLGAGATLGPGSSMLPDTSIGDGCVVGGRSIVMRGESLPAGTSWHGAPVVLR